MARDDLTRGQAALIPKPALVTPGSGRFVLDASTTIVSDPGAENVEDRLREWLPFAPRRGERSPAGNQIELVLRSDDSESLGPEGYEVSVEPEGVVIAAATPAGLSYGTQTFRQLLPPSVYRRLSTDPLPWDVHAVLIQDSPRFKWRGGMLDVGRHFMPVDFLFRYVDLLAAHKFNVFHIHLTEDQGWRFPSQRYPRLTEVGAVRKETALAQGVYGDEGIFDGTPHGGHYSLDDLRELVAYAAQRYVTVVPEIEFPGHVAAVLAAYPELGNTGANVEVATDWGVIETVLNIEETTLEFCRNVLDEVLEIFPSRYIHTGGDECPRTEWTESDAVHARVEELGLADIDEVQSWFTRQLDSFLTQRSRKLVGWDEILKGGLAEGATVMSYAKESGIAVARLGHDVVMTPGTNCYFDHYQSQDPDEPLAIGGCTTLADVYNYEPVPAELEEAEVHSVLGTQFQIWTEFIPTPRDVEYMAFPRACALAEVAWSGRERNEDDFLARLGVHCDRLDAMGVNYRPLEGPHPWQRGGTGHRRRRPSPW